MKLMTKISAAAALVAASPLALAHTQPGEGLVAGMLHPLTGIDHLVMFLALGAMMARLSAAQLPSGIASVLLALTAGVALGWLSGLQMGIEWMVLASMGVAAIVLAKRTEAAPSRLLMAALVVFHGWAHGLEMPLGAVTSFVPGMLISALALMLVGAVVGRLCDRRWLALGTAATAVLIGLGA